jgi:hypothetical protein
MCGGGSAPPSMASTFLKGCAPKMRHGLAIKATSLEGDALSDCLDPPQYAFVVAGSYAPMLGRSPSDSDRGMDGGA